MSPSTPSAVVFDLGGVLARICHTWEEAAASAGASTHLGGGTGLTSLQALDLYQAGILSFEQYAAALAVFAGCSTDEACRIHNSILVCEYPQVLELIQQLKQSGIKTGCLSNTNAAHWEHLALNGNFPAIQALELKMASHLVGLNKPDPAIFELYCETFSLEPEQIVYFDDHPLNVRSANLLGWHAFLIDPQQDTAPQMRACLQSTGVLP